MAEQLTDKQIDESVAWRVMGWKLLTTKALAGILVATDYWHEQDGKHRMLRDEWRPTRNIAQAWQVLEKFPWPQCWVQLRNTETGNWRCDIELRGGDGPVASAFDKSAPRAICLAALDAVAKAVREASESLAG